MDVYDLSHKLDETTQVYPGDPSVTCHQTSTVKKDGYSVCRLSLGSHSGTHIDAPYHFFEDGKTVDELELSLLIGPAVIVDLLGKKPRERILWDDLARADVASHLKTHHSHILLLRTGWPKHWKSPMYLDHPFLDKEAAKKLLEIGVRVLGVDTLNPDETAGEDADGDFGVHEVILGSGAMIVENLNLDIVPSELGYIHVSLLPLAITGSDGSPIRAIAWVPTS